MPSSREEPGRVDRDYPPFYPGDAWVDCWPIDLVDPAMFAPDNTRWFSGDDRDAGSPVMTGESTPRWVGGTGGGGAAWDLWHAPFVALVRAEPATMALSSINWEWIGYPEFRGRSDARIAANGVVLGRYRRDLADPRCVPAVPTPSG